MQARRFIQYGVLGGLVLAGLACAGHSGKTEEATVPKDTTTVQNPSGYVAPARDTTMPGVTDSSKWSPTKSGASEIKPGASTVGADSTVGID
jgi:hypothetical protein